MTYNHRTDTDSQRDLDNKDIIGLFGSEGDLGANFAWEEPRAFGRDVTEIGDGVVKYDSLGHAVIQDFGSIDVSDSSMLHLSVWRTNPDAEFKVKLVNLAEINGSPSQSEDEYIFGKSYGNPIPEGQWVQVEVPLAELSGLNDTSGIFQLVLSSHIYPGSGDLISRDAVRR